MPVDLDEVFGKKLVIAGDADENGRLKAWKDVATIEVRMAEPEGDVFYYVMKPIDMETLRNWPFLKERACWRTDEFEEAENVAQVWANELDCSMWVVRVEGSGRSLEVEVLPELGYVRAWRGLTEEMPSVGTTERPNETTPGYGEF